MATPFWLLLCIQINLAFCQVRPIWNVAHMVNALGQVHEYLDYGANGLEVDVDFVDGSPMYTYHGIPCDCFRDCLRWEYMNVFLDYLTEVADKNSPEYRENFMLLMLDLKVSSFSHEEKIEAAINLAKIMLTFYWKNDFQAVPYVVLSVPYTSSKDFIESFLGFLQQEKILPLLQDRFGFDLSMNEDLSVIAEMYSSLNINQNIWQGDGITNCLWRTTSRLIEAIEMRDSSDKTYIDKVYYWTVDRMETMRNVLRLGVDSVMTNYPYRLIDVLKEPEFSQTFRLATAKDNPWLRIPQKQRFLAHSGFGRTGSKLKGEVLVNYEEEDMRKWRAQTHHLERPPPFKQHK